MVNELEEVFQETISSCKKNTYNRKRLKKLLNTDEIRNLIRDINSLKWMSPPNKIKVGGPQLPQQINEGSFVGYAVLSINNRFPSYFTAKINQLKNLDYLNSLLEKEKKRRDTTGYFNRADKIAAEVSTWPEWKKAGFK